LSFAEEFIGFVLVVLDYVRDAEPEKLQAQEDAGLQFDLGVLHPATIHVIKEFVENNGFFPSLDANPPIFYSDDYNPHGSKGRAKPKV